MSPTRSTGSEVARRASEKLGGDVSALQVEKTLALMRQPVRNLPLDKFQQHGIERIVSCIELYTNSFLGDGAKFLYAECLSLWREKFGDIALDEAADAFRLVAEGKLAVDFDQHNLSGKLISTKFTVTLFAKVLRAYREWRRRIVSAAGESTELTRREQNVIEKRNRNEATRKAVIAAFEKLCIENDRFATWSDVPAWWADILRKAETFGHVSRAEREVLWKEARIEAVAEAKRTVLSGASRIDIAASLSESASDEMAAKATVIFGKMIIFHCLAPCSKST
jgi:hypothetical protein